jgi:hypothetical protein
MKSMRETTDPLIVSSLLFSYRPVNYSQCLSYIGIALYDLPHELANTCAEYAYLVPLRISRRGYTLEWLSPISRGFWDMDIPFRMTSISIHCREVDTISWILNQRDSEDSFWHESDIYNENGNLILSESCGLGALIGLSGCHGHYVDYKWLQDTFEGNEQIKYLREDLLKSIISYVGNQDTLLFLVSYTSCITMSFKNLKSVHYDIKEVSKALHQLAFMDDVVFEQIMRALDTFEVNSRKS